MGCISAVEPLDSATRSKFIVKSMYTLVLAVLNL